MQSKVLAKAELMLPIKLSQTLKKQQVTLVEEAGEAARRGVKKAKEIVVQPF
jgi:hypothetical protein